MRYRVWFFRPTFYWWDVLPFQGYGFVHLLETGLVIDGMLFELQFPLLGFLWRSMIFQKSIYTIPYSRIAKYEPPLDRTELNLDFHVLNFRTADEGFRWLAFSTLTQAEQLPERLIEYMTVAQTYKEKR